MNTNIENELIKASVLSNTNIPNQVFIKKFDQFLFFDASLRATNGLPTAIKKIIQHASAEPICAAIYTSISHKFLAFLDDKSDWEKLWTELDKKLFDLLVFESFAIFSRNEDWAVFQYYPVDVGVIGFNKSKLPLNFEHDVVDFFSCADIHEWCRPFGAYEDVKRVEYYGKIFLDMLIKNYGKNE
jgi:hypothetical protein